MSKLPKSIEEEYPGGYWVQDPTRPVKVYWHFGCPVHVKVEDGIPGPSVEINQDEKPNRWPKNKAQR